MTTKNDLPFIRFTAPDNGVNLDLISKFYNTLDFDFYHGPTSYCKCTTIINNIITYPSGIELGYPVVIHSYGCVRAFKTKELVKSSRMRNWFNNISNESSAIQLVLVRILNRLTYNFPI
jgi:hypothetical protein